VRAQLRSELLKQRSTGTGLGLFAAMLGLVLLAVLLHGFGLPAENLRGTSEQLMVLGRGEFLGSLFAALVGALAITSEIRHGTIRPTFLVTPARGRVLAAKLWASGLLGAAFGLAASALAVGAGIAVLGARGIDMRLDGSDHALLILGSAPAAALWGAIGVAVGAVVRQQVPTVVGLLAWLLFVEGLFVGDLSGVGEVGRFAPGAAAAAITGQDPDTALQPAVGLVVLVLYAAVAAVAGAVATTRRDVV
jgi:ABC-type transport system involved in multi-copper enzyme maturation permease subunit